MNNGSRSINHKRRLLSWLPITLLISAALYLFSLILAPYFITSPVFISQARDTVTRELEKPPTDQNRLLIPTIGVDIDIVTGRDESALLRGAWHRKPENGNPRDGGNFVLSAHRFDMGMTPAGTIKKSPFYHIDRLEIGDDIGVNYDGTRYEYTVTKKYRVDPKAVSIEARSEEPKLTLYSCTLRGSADGREVIEARLLSNRE